MSGEGATAASGDGYYYENDDSFNFGPLDAGPAIIYLPP